jgi:thioredoxin 2
MPSATAPCAFCGTLNRVDLDRVHALPKCGACAKPIRLDRPLAVSGEQLDTVLSGTDAPVLVDFHADWCQPCRMMAPVLDEIAHDLTGRALVVKLDTDRAPRVAERLGVRGLPTFVAFLDGRELGRQVGAVGKQQLLTATRLT